MRSCEPAGRLTMLLADGEHAHLHGREPERERAGVVLDQDPDEALERAEERAVDDEDRVLLVVRAHVGETEAGRHLRVELDRAELPRALEHVGDVEVDLRPVERALPRADEVLDLVPLERLDELALGEVPLLVGAELVVGPRRELGPRLDPEEAVEVAEVLETAVELGVDLLLASRRCARRPASRSGRA